jgi:hypothetical protein
MLLTLGLDSQLPFGKYRGFTVERIIREDPSYLSWCVVAIENLALDAEADAALKTQLDQDT